MAKRTIDNCTIIKRYADGYAPTPGTETLSDGTVRCRGYAREGDDEPIDVCKRCKLNVFYDDEVEFWISEAGKVGAW